MLLSKDDRVGAFQVTGVLGKGGMGEVYRARDTRLNREVALKVLPAVLANDPERLARFEREAQLLASLNHPNIATLYGMEESGAVKALVMELVEGPTLAELIKAGPIALEDAVPMALAIAEAIEYAHGRNVVHRDLKPANVKVLPDGPHGATVKVLDFGLAKALAGEQERDSDPSASATMTMGATATGAIMGTAAYMSPEQVKGKRADRRSDIWSFGVLLSEMLIGGHLYEGGTGAEIMAGVVKQAPPLERLPANTPSAVRRLIERCLEKDPHQRLQHIGEARIVLQKKDFTPEAASAPVDATPQKRAASWPWIAATAASILALAGLALVHFREAPPVARNLRFQIPAPAKATLGVFAVSPDGRRIVFIARDQLWLREMDSLEPTPIPGTTGATYPFWSPDSVNIAFFAQEKLKRIALAGGPAVTLCDAASGRGGSWSREGTIIFSPGPTVPLQRVAAAGGVPSNISKLRSTDGTEGHRFPEFLPDGKHFLYLAQSSILENTGLFVGSLDPMEDQKRLLDNQSNALYAPPQSGARWGHLLYRRETTLMAQPFDPDALAFVGDVFPVAESVGNTANAGFGSFSVSANGFLATSRGLSASAQATWFDRSGKRLAAVTEPVAFRSMALSPDGTKLTYGTGDNDAATQWIQDLARGTATKITFTGRVSGSAWSPDSTRVVYGSSNVRVYVNDLLERSATGEGAEKALLQPGAFNAQPWDWSADGNWIVYRVDGEKTGNDLWLLPLTGDRKPIPFLTTPASENLAKFSPDSKLIAYRSTESGQAQVYVQPVVKNGAKWLVSPAGGTNPSWRRDGKEMYYVADRMLMAVPVRLAPSFEPGKPVALFELPSTDYVPSADGQRFIAVVPVSDTAVAPPITVVTDWLAGIGK